MSDASLRTLERAFLESGDPQAEIALLRERLRLGQVTRERLAVAAAMEHPAALALVEARPLESFPQAASLPTWLTALPTQGVLGVARAAVLAVGLTEPAWREQAEKELGPRVRRAVRELELDLPDDALVRLPGDVLASWALDPRPDAYARVRAVVGLMEELSEEYAEVPLGPLAAVVLSGCEVLRKCNQILSDEPIDHDERATLDQIRPRESWQEPDYSEEPEEREARRTGEALLLTRELLDRVGLWLDDPQEAVRGTRSGWLAWLCGHPDPLSGEREPLLTPEELNWDAPSDVPVRLQALTRWRVTDEAGEEVTSRGILKFFHDRRVPGAPLSESFPSLWHFLYEGCVVFDFKPFPGTSPPEYAAMLGVVKFTARRPLTARELRTLLDTLNKLVRLEFSWSGKVSDPYDPDKTLTFRLEEGCADRLKLWQRPAPDLDRSTFQAPHVKPFHDAVGQGDLERVQAMLAEGVDAHCRDRFGSTPAWVAVYRNQLPALRILLEHLPVDADLRLATTEAAEHHRRRPAHLEALLAHGADPNVSVPAKEQRPSLTPLMAALRGSSRAAFERLLEAGADPNHPADDGQTVLHRARSAKDAVYLLRHGADPTVRDEEGRTPRDWFLEGIRLHRLQEYARRDFPDPTVCKQILEAMPELGSGSAESP